MKKGSSITVTPFYQRLFIATVILGWLVPALFLLHMYLTDTYIGAGTWTFQITVWLLPIVFFALSLWFAIKRFKGRLQRTFFATLLTTMGISAYACIQQVEEYFYINDYQKSHPITGSSYWAAFGNEWVMMGVCLVLFAGALLALSKRSV